MNYSKISGQFVCKMAMLLAFVFAACSEDNSPMNGAHGGAAEEQGYYALAGRLGDVYPKLLKVADSAFAFDSAVSESSVLALAHACRPEVTAAEIAESLNFLVKADLLKKDKDGNYAQTDKVVTTGPMNVTPLAVRGLHHQMGEFALDAIENVPQDERHFSGLTLGITREAYDEIVQKIAEFRKEIIAIATREPATDEVYRLNVQFFPMTNKSLNKKD